MVASIDFSKKSIVIVSGASRGIGSAIAVNLAKRLNPDSVFLLLARSTQGLEKCKQQILEVNNKFDVHLDSVDLSKPNLSEYQSIMNSLISSANISDVHYGIFIHNAGLIGTLKKTTNLIDLAAWQSYFDMNLFSATLLNSAFITAFRDKVKQLVVVNITSLCGRQPFENMAMYGSGKAARELFFKVLAVEEPDVVVLNYSPGPVDTDMFNRIIKDAESEEVKKNFKSVKESTVLTPDQTVEKLLHILEKGNYDSGDVIDYYDCFYGTLNEIHTLPAKHC